MEKHFIFCAFLFLSGLLFAGCDSPHTAKESQVRIALPRTAANASVSQWTVRHASGAGTGSQFTAGAGTDLVLPMEKDVPSAIIAFPSGTEPSAENAPVVLGLIYPYTAALSKDYAFPAHVLFNLYSSPDCIADAAAEGNIHQFNWPKLVQSCAAYENPWLLQEERIATAIKKGTFKKSDLKLHTSGKKQ